MQIFLTCCVKSATCLSASIIFAKSRVKKMKKLLNTECPYCHHPQMPEPSDVPRPYGKCPNIPVCGLKSRAAISYTKDGIRTVRYVATNHRTRPRMRDYHVRWWDDDVRRTSLSAQQIFKIGVLTTLGRRV